MNAGALVALLMVALLLAACSRQEAELLTSSTDLRAKVVAEMQAVEPHVTKAHIEECRSKLETISWLGAKYQAYADFRPDVLVSCIGQMSMPNLPSSAPSAKRVTYAVRMKKVEGAYGTGSPQDMGICVFELQDGKVSLVGAQRTPKVHRNNVCVKLST